MSQYSGGLYLRMNAGDTGTMPRGGSTCSSPDLIVNTDKPIEDPSTLQDYGKSFPAGAMPNRFNYAYGRAKNLSDKAIGGKLFTYYVPATLLGWPSKWIPIFSVNHHTPYLPLDPVDPGKVAYTKEPGGFTPEGISGSHYCMIGRLVNDGQSNPMPTDTVVDLARLLQTNPGFGQRNIQTVSAAGADKIVQVTFTQEAPTNTFLFFGFCRNVTPGISITCSAAGPGMNPAINIPETTVDTAGPFYTRAIQSTIEKGFTGTATFQIFFNGKTISPDAEFGVVIGSFVPSNNPAVAEGIFRPLKEWGVALHGDADKLTKEFGVGLNFAPLGSMSALVVK